MSLPFITSYRDRIRLTDGSEAAACITIARAADGHLGKTITVDPTGEKPPKKSEAANVIEYHFWRMGLVDGGTVNTSPLANLYRLLSALVVGRDAIVIGDVATVEPKMPNTYRRAKRGKNKNGEMVEPTIVDTPSALIALDMDKIAVPPGFDFADRKAIVDVIRAQIPEEMRQAQMLVCCTASHGYFGKVCARVFLLADRSLSLMQKYAMCWDYVKIMPTDDTHFVDPAMFRTAQLAFVGAEIIGAPDAYAGVRFFLSGPDATRVHISDERADVLAAEGDVIAGSAGQNNGTTAHKASSPAAHKAAKVMGEKVARAKAKGWRLHGAMHATFDVALAKIRGTACTRATIHDDCLDAVRAAYKENNYRDDADFIVEEIQEAIRDYAENARLLNPSEDLSQIETRIDDVPRLVRDASQWRPSIASF